MALEKIEVTLQLEENLPEEEIDSIMKEQFPSTNYYTRFRQGKKYLILEINEDET